MAEGSAYDKFDTLVADREEATSAAHNSYSAFDPTADTLPQSSYNAPDPEGASTVTAQSAYAAPEQLANPVTAGAVPTASGYSEPDSSGAIAPVKAPATPVVAEYSNAAAPPPATPTAASPYAVTSAGGQTEAPQKFVMKQRRDKNWNEELQELVDSPDSAGKFHQLSALIREFNFVADTFGKIIISEMSYPAAMRTVKPVSAGGQAGGEKYVHKNIFFKFAIDLHGIYGGDEHAMKAAEHDLKGLIWYSNSGVKQLHYPLMSLVDYLGYRLIALSVLPLASGGKSLLYGSCDGGQTVNTIDPSLNALMEKAGDRMKLKKHRAGLEEATKKWISGPVDIEGHKGLDGRYYVLDYARTFPCEAFSRKDGNFVKGQHLYKLLRPELVRSNVVPLSSDAFSAWGIGDRDSVLEVQQATYRLYNMVVPALADQIDKFPAEKLTPVELITQMHQAGVNVRHLGRLRSKVKTDSHRRLILVEMTARVVKNEIRSTLRKSIFEHPLSEEPARRSITPILNRIMAASEDSPAYWTELKDRVAASFVGAFQDQEEMHELSVLINFEDTEVRRHMLSRLQQLAGFRIDDLVAESFCKQRKWRLLPIDVGGFVTQFRSSNLMDISEALSCLYEAQDLKGAEAYRMADAALNIFKRALSKMHFLGNVDNLLILAKLFFRCSKEGALSAEDCRKRAKETLDLAAELDPEQKHLYKLELGNILIQFNKYSEAKEYFQDVKQSQTDPAIIALCDAAIVTALHLEGSTEQALNLCETLVGGNMTSAPKEWLWVLGVLRFFNATARQGDKLLQLYDAAPPLLAALQAGFLPAPDGHFQLQLGSAMQNATRKVGLLCLASCHPALANYIFANVLVNFDGIFPLSKSALLDEHFTRLFLGNLSAPVKEIFASHCTAVSGGTLAKVVAAHNLQLFAGSRTTLSLEDVRNICNAPCAPSLRELELDGLKIDEPILPYVVKSMTSLTALSLQESRLDQASFNELFKNRSTLRELCLSGEGKWYESPDAKEKRLANEVEKQKNYDDAKAEREKKIADGAAADTLPEIAPWQPAPHVWLEPVLTPLEGFAATGLLILELPGFINLRTADVLAVLKACPSLERLDLAHSRGFSHEALFNRISDTRVSCFIASSGLPYYWSDSPLRLEMSRLGQAMNIANRSSPPIQVKHLNNQANLSIPGLVLSVGMNSSTISYRELPFARHRFETSAKTYNVQNNAAAIMLKYTEPGAAPQATDVLLTMNMLGPANSLRALTIKGVCGITGEVKHLASQPWPNQGTPIGQEKYTRSMQHSTLDIPRARRPVTLLMIVLLQLEEWASTKQF